MAGARKADLYWESELEALRKRAGALETEPRLSEAQKQAIRGLGMEGNPVVRLRPNGDVEARTSRGDGRRVKYLITPAGETAMTTSLPPIRSMTLSAVLGAVGDSIRRLASPLAPPWFLGHVSLPAEPVRAEFDGFFKRVYVTDHWVVVHGAWGYSKIRLADIADLRSGF